MEYLLATTPIPFYFKENVLLIFLNKTQQKEQLFKQYILNINIRDIILKGDDMTNYEVKSFGTGFIGQLAQRIDRSSYEGKENYLDGKEISLFSNELNRKGITFDWSKVGDSSYINDVENQYKNSLDNVYTKNTKGTEIIEKHKENYTIKKLYNQNQNGSFTACYEITAKVDVSLSELKEDLGIPNGVISNCNDGYGQYDNNSHYIENKPMKNVTIKIPADKLGADINSSGFIETILNIFS